MVIVRSLSEQVSQRELLHVAQAFLHTPLEVGLAVPAIEAVVEEPLVLLEQAIRPPPRLL